MTIEPTEDDDVVLLPPLPVRPETIGRLARYARGTGKPPLQAAGELLDELLYDDDFFNAAGAAGMN